MSWFEIAQPGAGVSVNRVIEEIVRKHPEFSPKEIEEVKKSIISVWEDGFETAHSWFG